MKRTVGVIGGGAAGMMAAICAAGQGADVTLLEGNDRLGKKILATGNGKCNLGNEKLDLEEYYTENPAFLEQCFHAFGTEEMKAFFHDLGLMIKSKNGYLYPVSEQAAVVLDVLRYAVEAAGVHIVTECKVTKLVCKTDGFEVVGGSKQFCFDKVILACGSKAAPKTGSDGSGYLLAKELGHKILPVVPALVQLKCKEDYFKMVAGVRADARLQVMDGQNVIAWERGELQLTDYGISGIPVFQISRVINYMLLNRKSVEVSIDLLPDYDEKAFAKLVENRNHLPKQCTVEMFFTGMLNKKIMLLFMKLAGLKPTDDMAKVSWDKIQKVYDLCKDWRVFVTGSNPFENAQVCAGGVDLKDISENMESRKVPGLFFAGEILDVDGKCGGYNLQWAWCSGYLAGNGAAK